MPDYTWVNHAPIVHVPVNQEVARVRRFQELVRHYGSPETGPPLVGRMADHASGAIDVGNFLVAKSGRDGHVTFEYRLCGEPIALMQINLDVRHIEIVNLTTHPGSEKAGGIMVEFALNRAAHYNAQSEESIFSDGKLQLKSFNDASTSAYLALGFTLDRQGGREMSLNAKRSPLWHRVEGGWRLASYATSHYLSAD
ncbi:MAG: hypothetical protein V4813_15140 [Gemmatimonadota bacterium]